MGVFKSIKSVPMIHLATIRTCEVHRTGFVIRIEVSGYAQRIRYRQILQKVHLLEDETYEGIAVFVGIVLVDRGIVDQDFPFCGYVHPGNKIEKSRLPRADLARDDVEARRIEGKTDVFQDGEFGVAFYDMVKTNSHIFFPLYFSFTSMMILCWSRVLVELFKLSA